MVYNTRVSFEIAKLAKIKGYLIPEAIGYSSDGEFMNTEDGREYNYIADNTHLNRYIFENYYYAPMIEDIINWLDEYHNLSFKIELCKFKDKDAVNVYIMRCGRIIDNGIMFERNEYDIFNFSLRLCLLYKDDWELYKLYRTHKVLANRYCTNRDEFEGEWWINSTEQISNMIAAYLINNKELFIKDKNLDIL